MNDKPWGIWVSIRSDPARGRLASLDPGQPFEDWLKLDNHIARFSNQVEAETGAALARANAAHSPHHAGMLVTYTPKPFPLGGPRP